MNQSKEKDQNFLPKDADAFLARIHSIIVEFRQENSIDKGKFATDAGLKKNSLGVIEDDIRTEKGKKSTIDLMTLVKILIRYPELGIRIGAYLSGNTDKNITAAPFPEEAEVRQELRKLRDDLRILKELTTSQAKALLHFTGVETIEEG